MKNIDIINGQEYIQRLGSIDEQRRYGAMYSSWVNAIVTDPNLMLVPVDDHMVHRGDAVFEAFKYIEGAFYDLDQHIDRLFKSAQFINLESPFSKEDIISLCIQTMKASALSESLFRLYLSRGPGDFSVNPYSTLGCQLYIVATPFSKVDEDKYANGCTLIKSSIPVKPHFFSKVKSCNYMQNVLMKKESIDRGSDFAVNFTDQGDLCEGPTENILVLKKNGELMAPLFDYTLRGTTLVIVMELAKQLVAANEIVSVGQNPITEVDLIEAKEVMMVGTTLEVLPITTYEGQLVGNGQVGVVAKHLRQLLKEDMITNKSRRTLLD